MRRARPRLGPFYLNRCLISWPPMFAKVHLRWRAATAQTALAELLIHWHSIEYARALQKWNVISIWDYWTLPSKLLIVIDLPPTLLCAPILLLSSLRERPGHVAFLCLVFLFWAWVASPFEKKTERNPIQTVRWKVPLWIGAGVGICALAFVPSTMGLSVKVFAGIFWAVLATLFCHARLSSQKSVRSLPTTG